MARSTKQRAAVGATFGELEGFHSAQDVYARMRASGDSASRSHCSRSICVFAMRLSITAARISSLVLK